MYHVELVERPAGPWAVCRVEAGLESPAIDYFRAQPSAQHAVSLLNQGLAQVEPHRPVGCRIQPLPPGRLGAA